MKNKKNIEEIISILKLKYPEIKIQLNHKSAFELLIATILSAQCTDARVNIVTESLFKKYLLPEDYLKVDILELEKDIFSTGFYKNKAKNIRLACEKLINDFNSSVPDNMEDLLKLPGVGRKTANVVLGHCFDTPGIVVDTHVTRITNLLGIVKTNDAVKIEFELMELINKKDWVDFTHLMIYHGRETCIARRPKCETCTISHLCSFYQKK